jgi:HK97 family phage prohead protease
MSESMKFREFISEIRDTDDKERSFTHAISDETPDAHGSIIRVDGWDLRRFKANPVVLFAHNSHDLPIGRSKRIWKEDGKLMARTEFAGAAQDHDLAETAYKLVRDGFIRAWSVGFLPKEREPRKDISDEEKHVLFEPVIYTKTELMEYSLVPVPSNPHALLDAKRAGHDVDLVMAWFEEHQKIASYWTSRGVLLPVREPKPMIEVDLDFSDLGQFLLEESIEEFAGR